MLTLLDLANPNALQFDGVFLLVAVALAFALMVWGYSTKMGIYNLFSVGLWIFIATQVITYTPFVLVIVGIIIFQLYYTFFGGRD